MARRTPEQIAAEQEAFVAKSTAHHRAMKVQVVISRANRFNGRKVHSLVAKSVPPTSYCGYVIGGDTETMTLGEIHDLPPHESCKICWRGPR